MTKDNVLYYLKEQQGYVSGQAISEKLGLSRMAVSAAVSSLRDDGYQIESSPRRGYRLVGSPDHLTVGELMTCLPSERMARVICLDSVDSTNRYLKDLADKGASEGQVVIANEQTEGRGRRGRSFLSLKDKGIYFSILLRPDTKPAAMAEITAWTAVAVGDAVEKVCGIHPDIKWVNDLLMNDRKITGILTEMSLEAETGMISSVIIGIGINVNQDPDDFPEDLRPIAGSLKTAVGQTVSRAALAAQMVVEMDKMIAAWPHDRNYYINAYKKHCTTTGKAINVIAGGTATPAESLDIGDDFSLRVRYEDGREEALNSGEVSVRPRL